jgi:hypothetical protein
VGSASGDTFPQVLTVTMASAFPEDVTVAVTSSAPAALGVVGGGVTIPAGQTSAVVKLNPRAQADSVTLTATLGGSMQQTTVRVLGENEQATVARLNPAEVTMVPGGTVTLTVELDRPAPANTEVALSADPADLGTFGATDGTLDVLLNATQASVTFTANPEATGSTGTVTARLGDSSASTTVTLDQDAPRLLSVEATSAEPVPAGGTRVLRLTLDRPAPADAMVALVTRPGTAGSRFGTVPATVTVGAGNTTAEFTFTADAEGGGTGTVAASLYGITRSTELTVTPPPPKLATLSPATATVLAGRTFTFTVTLDRAAQTDATDVALTLAPAAGVGSVPATVRVARGATTATFDFTAEAVTSPAQVELTASFGGVEQKAQVSVIVPAGSGLVINEVDYDQNTADTKEFVELYNTSASTVSLEGVVLVFVNGAASQLKEYARVNLSSAGSLAPGQYLVVGSALVLDALNSPNVKELAIPATGIQNGNPDAVVLFDLTQGRVIDSLSYGGAVSGASITGVTGTFNLQEGEASTVGVVDTVYTDKEVSLARSPDSVDTNVNANDFKRTVSVTPGAPNVIVDAPPLPAPAP